MNTIFDSPLHRSRSRLPHDPRPRRQRYLLLKCVAKNFVPRSGSPCSTVAYRSLRSSACSPLPTTKRRRSATRSAALQTRADRRWCCFPAASDSFLFGFILYAVLLVRPVLIVSGAGVINLAIGIGFLIDYSMQKRELARFGMEVDTEAMLGRGPGV